MLIFPVGVNYSINNNNLVPLLLHGDNIASPTVVINNGNTVDYSVSFSNNNVINSSDAPKYGDGALQFNPDNASNLNCISTAFNVGSGNCTIECFFRLTGDISGDKIIWEMRPTNTNGAFPVIAVRSNRIALGFNSSEPVVGTPTITTNTYYYVAVKKIGTTTELWFEGSKLGDFTSGDWGSPGRILLGFLAFDSFAPQTRLRGQIDEFRFTLANIDVSVIPTSPFPNS